jgi:methyltransferase family protein
MLERGRASAAQHQVESSLTFIQADFNEWIPEHEYDAVLANQALHHVLKLEDLFARIKSSLKPGGSLIVSDMIGRNGHQRWPEALDIVREFWRELPPSYRYNHSLERYEEMYQNYDCSGDGFEGIRSEDILPLLLQNFHFHLFVAFANVIEPFVDRAFGYNFDAQAAWDRSFVDAVHQRDEAEFAAGRLKPTHMLAVLGTQPDSMLFHAPLTPQFSVRSEPQFQIEKNAFESPYAWHTWPHSPQTELEIACRRLEEAFRRLKEAEDRIIPRDEMVLKLNAEFEERTRWALELNQQVRDQAALDRHLEQLDAELEQRTTWALGLKQELEHLTRQFEERTAWALHLDRELAAHTAQTQELTTALEQLEWARGLDRRFHKPLSAAFRALARLRNRRGARS